MPNLTGNFENDPFFPYACDETGEPFCERVLILNLALGYEETQFCLPVLAAQKGVSEAALVDTLKSYILSRDCFRTPWEKVDVTHCPKKTTNTCFCG